MRAVISESEITGSTRGQLLATCLTGSAANRGSELLAGLQDLYGALERAIEANEAELLDMKEPAGRARAATNLSARLSVAGRPQEAHARAVEAVLLSRDLAASHPDAFLPHLGAALVNLSVALVERGWRVDSLAAAEEAVAIARQLVAGSDEHLGLLAVARSGRFLALHLLGERRKAFLAAEEALGSYRRLAVTPALLPGLAMAHSNRVAALIGLTRPVEGLSSIEEAVAMERRLVAEGDCFSCDLAGSLIALAQVRFGLDRKSDWLGAIDEAISIYRRLDSPNPEAVLPDLGRSLRVRSGFCSIGRRYDDAVANSEEAVAISRRLADVNPEAQLADLANALRMRSLVFTQVNRHSDALDDAEEVLAIGRRLAESCPQAHLPDLERSLGARSIALAKLERRDDALADIQEAVAIGRRLADADPETHLPALARSLPLLSEQLVALGRHGDADEAMEELLRIRRHLAEHHPEDFSEAFVGALRTRSQMLSDAGRHEEATVVITEAVEVILPRLEADPGSMSGFERSVLRAFVDRFQQARLLPDPAILARLQAVLNAGSDAQGSEPKGRLGRWRRRRQ